jgi:hypothetical protein
MKLTLSWLKDHLDATASLAEIVDTLPRIGLEVERRRRSRRRREGLTRRPPRDRRIRRRER